MGIVRQGIRHLPMCRVLLLEEDLNQPWCDDTSQAPCETGWGQIVVRQVGGELNSRLVALLGILVQPCYKLREVFSIHINCWMLS